jgi:ABC-2 type transport system ATP-binding protein
MKESLISIENIHKNFGDKKILSNINFKFYDGEILGILGFSGTGKTTVLNLVCGLMFPDKGNIIYRVDGKSSTYKVNYPGKKVRKMIGLSNQRASLYENLTVYDNLSYFGELHDMKQEKIENKALELLKIFELEDARMLKICELSDGMRKRVDLACALIHSPKVLLLDEPTANLDFRLRRDLLNYIKIINDKGISIIFISHFIDEIEKIATKVLMLHEGKSKVVLNKNIKSSFLSFVKEDKKNG